MCVPAYAPALDYGGPVTTIQLLARGLADLGVDVEILTADFGPGRSRVPVGRRTVDGIPVTYLRRIVSRRWVSIAPGSGGLVRRGRFDVLHCFGLRDGTVTAAAFAGARARLPIVLEPMGMAVPRMRNLRGKRLFDRLASAVTAPAAVTVATSELEARELGDLGYAPVVVRHNPLGTPSGGVAGRPKVYDLAFIGRLHRKKQLEVLVEVLVRRPSTRAVVAGPDEDGSGAKLDALAAARGVADRLERHAWVSAAERQALLSAAKLFVLPSFTENFGNAAAEALGAGVPVVVTDQCGVAELVAKFGAGVVTSIDPEAIVLATISLLDNDDKYRRAASVAARSIASLASDSIAREQLAIYRSVVPIA